MPILKCINVANSQRKLREFSFVLVQIKHLCNERFCDIVFSILDTCYLDVGVKRNRCVKYGLKLAQAKVHF